MSGRPTTEIVVLIFATTVCFILVATGAAVALLEIRDSSVDTDNIVEAMDGIVQVLIGAVLGYLARGTGRTDHGSVGRQRPDASPDERTEP